MRRLTIATAGMLALLAAPAFAEDTFEAAAGAAQRIKRVDDIVWALTATCNQGTDTEQRQCRRVRDARAAELRNGTLLVEGDREAFTVGAWSAAKKSASLTLTSCIRCSGIDVEGKQWFVAGTRDLNQPPRFQAGKQAAPVLSDTARTFADAASAKSFAKSVATSKVQFVVRVPENPIWTDTNRQGVALEVVAYRVYSPCDGGVVVANPKASPGEIDKRACAGIPPLGVEVDQLTPAMIKVSITPVLDAAKLSCFQKYQATGNGKLKLQISNDGVIVGSQLVGELENSETAKCIEAAVRNAKLPKSKKPKTACAVPISLP